MVMDKWTEALSVGVEEIDNQHKDLFDMVNNLFIAAKQGRDVHEIHKVVKFLEDYVLNHFKLEEDYMEKYNYNEIKSHKAKHREFLGEFLKFKADLKSKEDAITWVVYSVEGWLYKWLNDHFSDDDKRFGAFLKKMAQ